jgi:UDP-N-acetylglucosamine 4-epimerase
MQTNKLVQKLAGRSLNWLVTGAAGFIGSHLVEALLKLDQKVIGLDNLCAGKLSNLENVKSIVGPDRYANFRFEKASIEDPEICFRLCEGVDFVLHQAALGSVSRSMKEPSLYNRVNVGGFLNMLIAARDQSVTRFVYASSSSVYGDEPNLPKREERIGKALSPYALSKSFNEQYAELFASAYGLPSVGLRYFNVFGPRQDPNGDYAAVIPRWVSQRLAGNVSTVYGDGSTSRDFCYVSNVVQANLLAALTEAPISAQVFNVALGDQTSLLELYNFIDQAAGDDRQIALEFADFREGDIKHSKADISNIKEKLGFEPDVQVAEGLKIVLDWYKKESLNVQ